jgi:hypothetical protein
LKDRKSFKPAPFAVGLDGLVYMSALEFDGVDTLEDAIGVMKNKKFFVGVQLTRAEVRRLLPFLGNGGREAAGYIAGGRHWKK